ncbi:MAG: TIGR03560 family F420-dependent LLM class oxidoreductase [Chloroflexi bacterium]|nr:TIGR03560 family F420-dependent LLM class oxidoreductase [Chloroflexota bacterium]
MRFALMTEPQQGLSYEELLALVVAAEKSGFESFLRSDHYASFPGEAGLPTTDAWATLAGLARETDTITLGTLVSPVTFRLPGNFAKLVTTVDEMSGGRVEVGLGAGWNDDEHAQQGLPFPEIGERFDMLEEQLAILHGLWTEPDGWSFEGRHWQVRDARFYPKPVSRPDRRHPKIILGGDGKPRSAALAARYADEYNLVSATAEKAREVFPRVRRAFRDAGRAEDAPICSAMTGVLVAATEGELRDRVRAQVEMLGSGDGVDTDAWLAERRRRWIMGTPDEALERIRELETAGVQRICLQDFLPRDLDMIRLLGEQVLPQAS